MATDDLLQGEARERRRMAVVAGLAALLTLLAPIVGVIVLRNGPDNLPGSALYRSDHQLALSVSAACSVLGLVGIVLVLDFLYRATRARNPELPRMLRPLPWVGGVGLACASVAFQVIGAVKLDHFATHGSQTYDEAKAAGDFGALAYVGLIAQLAFALALVMISINALRVGLLTRFLGYLGAISAALFILPLVPLPVVQVYWLGALAVLFAGRSPGGTPPAWERGEAVPWPSTAELREQRVRAADAARGESPAPASSGAAPVRRKRKKRR